MKAKLNPIQAFNAKTQNRKDNCSTPDTEPDFSAPWRLGDLVLHSVRAALLVTAVTLLPAAAHAQAIEAWVQRFNGPGNGTGRAEAWPWAMASDASGNVYVLGTTYVGRVVSDYDYVTIKYSSAGVPLWTNYYNGPVNGYDDGAAVALDADANLFVTGSSFGGTGSGSDYLTIKYSSAGVPLWTNRGPAGALCALALDPSGDVVVAGDAGGCTIIKYSTSGALLWSRTYVGGIGTFGALAIDASGGVVVNGYSGWPLYYCTTIKYSSAGALLWTRTNTCASEAMAVDADGNVLVSGRSDPGVDADCFTVKYSSAGALLWTNRGPAGHALAVAVDASHDVYVTGELGPDSDYGTIKYSSAGVPLWTNCYHSPGNYGGAGKDVAFDANDNVFVTGTENRSGWPPNAADWVTIAYSRDGMPLWTNSYNGPASSMDQARAIAVDTKGNVYVTGTSRDSSGHENMLTIKYVTPPIITRQPLSQTNAVGTTASFTVEVAGSAPFSYQWRLEGTNLVDGGHVSGVVTTNLLIANVQLADAGGNTVVVTNAYGSVTSSVAQLIVTIPPSPGWFSNLSYSRATGLSFIFRDATVGRPYRIQRSSSMAAGSWTDWQSFTYTEPIFLTDMGATGAERRFYRAISP